MRDTKNPPDSPRSALRSMWEFPVVHRGLQMVSEPLGLPFLKPRALEDALIDPQQHEDLIADIHGRLLGLARGRSAKEKWLTSLSKFVGTFPEDFERVWKGTSRETEEKRRKEEEKNKVLDEKVKAEEGGREITDTDMVGPDKFDDEFPGEESPAGEETRWGSKSVGEKEPVEEDSDDESRPFRFEDVLADLGMEPGEPSEEPGMQSGTELKSSSPESRDVTPAPQGAECSSGEGKPTQVDEQETARMSSEANDLVPHVRIRVSYDEEKASIPDGEENENSSDEHDVTDVGRSNGCVTDNNVTIPRMLPSFMEEAEEELLVQKAEEAKVRLESQQFFSAEHVNAGRIIPSFSAFSSFEEYCEAKLAVRVNVLKDILERVIFEQEHFLRAGKLELQPWEMRVDDLGWDTNGNRYFYFYDGCRIYREPDPILKARVQRQKERRKRREKEQALMRKEKREEKRRRGNYRMPRRRTRRARLSFVEEEPDCEISLGSCRAEDTTDAEEGRSTTPTYDEEIRKCDSWEVVVEGCEDLRSFIDGFQVPPEPRLYRDRTLIKYFEQLLSGWEAEERRAEEEKRRKEEEGQRMREREERRKEIEYLMTHQKRSSRVRAITEKREQERREREKEEQREADEKARIKKRLKMVERRIKALDRQRKIEMGVKGVEDEDADDESPEPGQPPTVRRSTRMRARREAYSAKEEEEEVQPTTELKTENEELLIDDEDRTDLSEANVNPRLNWQYIEDDAIPTRLLDRFILYDKDQHPARLEQADRAAMCEDAKGQLFGQGILVPRIINGRAVDGGEFPFPERVKLGQISEWCIEYGREPRLWIRTKHAWYELRHPARDYESVYESARRKFEICSRLVILSTVMKSQAITYEKGVELLGMKYMDMKPNTEDDILNIRDFIIVQIDRLHNKSLMSSGFIRRLKKLQRDEQKAKERAQMREKKKRERIAEKEREKRLKRSAPGSAAVSEAKRQEGPYGWHHPLLQGASMGDACNGSNVAEEKENRFAPVPAEGSSTQDGMGTHLNGYRTWHVNPSVRDSQLLHHQTSVQVNGAQALLAPLGSSSGLFAGTAGHDVTKQYSLVSTPLSAHGVPQMPVAYPAPLPVPTALPSGSFSGTPSAFQLFRNGYATAAGHVDEAPQLAKQRESSERVSKSEIVSSLRVNDKSEESLNTAGLGDKS